MYGIKEILIKLIEDRDLTEKERFELLQNKKINPNVINYLKERFSNLYIEVLGIYEGSLFELMEKGQLEGWCWQTTESAIVFLNDNDYIERGNIFFNSKTPYYHSWICFNYKNKEYVLDPSLNILCKKSDYSRIFHSEVEGTVKSKYIKEALLKLITTPKKEEKTQQEQEAAKFIKSLLGDHYEQYRKNKKDEFIANDIEDPNAPLYRNGSGYKVKVEKGKIKQLKVHYYHSDC